MKIFRFTAVLMTLLTVPAAYAAPVRQISPDCEAAVALSAGPRHLREGAGVYVLGTEGFELRKESRNGFVCLVERNHPDSLIPQCFDTRSRAAHVARILDEGRMIRAGSTYEEVLAHREAAFASGEYVSADGPGVAYMISDYNYIMAASGKIVKVAPHVMYHAPGMTDVDIGADRAAAIANPGMPFINDGGPQGFMIGFTQSTSDSSDVVAACAGQLPDGSALPPFPPQSGG